MKRIAMLVAIALAVTCSLAAQDSWYVCLGSFKKQSNADNYVKYPASRNLSARIVDVNLKDGRLMHRVLQSQGYSSYADAYDRRSKLQKQDFITRLGINDLWVCKAAAESPSTSSGETPALRLEPTDPNPAAYRKVPTWGSGALDDNQEFRFNPDGDFEIVTDRGFGHITVTRYEFNR